MPRRLLKLPPRGAHDPKLFLFWTGFFIGFAACLATGLTVHLVRDWRERAAFISTLSSAERDQLRGFETVNGDWRQFRDLLHQ